MLQQEERMTGKPYEGERERERAKGTGLSCASLGRRC